MGLEGALRILSNFHFSIRMSGSGLLWCWGFLRFFWSQSAVTNGASSVLGDLPYLGSTLLVSLVVASAVSHAYSSSFRTRLADLGCLLLVLGVLLGMASRTAGLNGSEFELLSKIVQGGGIGVFFIAWGSLYVSAETESVEHAFMGWFPILVVLLAIAAGINHLEHGATFLYTGLLALLPLASLICFRASERLIDESNAENALFDGYSESARNELLSLKNIVWPLVNLACVFAATSLAWNAFLFRVNIGFEQLIGLFALGVTILFFVIWLALRVTRHFSLSTLYRWALPFMAIGVTLYQFSNTLYVIPVFLCLSIVNIGFEVMGKLFCIYIAKRKPNRAVGIISIGFATASIGGIVGTGLWACVLEQFGPSSQGGTLLVALVVFIIAASIALGNDNDSRNGMTRLIQETASDPNEDNRRSNFVSDEIIRDDANGTRCIAIAKQYGLSSRELEVLILLSQGRSRAHIRETLYISKGTVDSHIHHIYSKIGITSKDELMRLLLD